ncbi:hypothetical protein M2447_001192 [Ereboglobus sp. PH5-10]|uniref:hypothetical protein n=1 Tax=Ereboglobus sp. PH5-10 TaxID=2940629 RepID=UPI002404C1F0|nr:hypothetical protein [Ereboglobus sp. PH5-10]MDF9827103.1 hypothetical protein [Ereboglobus sp. PH5-10]
MKKFIAILCLAVASVSLVWKIAAMAFSLQPATTRTTVIVAPDGTTTTRTETLGKVITVHNLSAAEGTQLVVKDGTVVPLGTGQVTTSAPFVGAVNNVLAWASIVLLLIAGLWLYRSPAKPKTVKPDPAPAPAA